MNMQNILKQAQQMQAAVGRIENELGETLYNGSAGGDAVKVEINGANELLSVVIDDNLLDKTSKDMLQDLIILATNNALQSAKVDRDEKMGAITQGVKMPGIF